MLNQKSLKLGAVYRIDVVGVVHSGILAEVVGFDCSDRAEVRALNAGMLKDAVLKRQDYVPLELFAESVDDPKVSELADRG